MRKSSDERKRYRRGMLKKAASGVLAILARPRLQACRRFSRITIPIFLFLKDQAECEVMKSAWLSHLRSGPG